jgi:cytochrome c
MLSDPMPVPVAIANDMSIIPANSENPMEPEEKSMLTKNWLAILAACVVGLASNVALAEGDAEKGEKVFRKCKACHSVEEGVTKPTGPNLLGVVGRNAAATEFKYSSGLGDAAEAGLVWETETLDGYLANPKKFLQVFLDDKKIKNKMKFKLKKEGQRADVIAYLQSLSE